VTARLIEPDNRRPRTPIGLLYEVLKSIERSRGSPAEHAERVQRLVILPLFAMRLFTVGGVVAGTYLLSDKRIDLPEPAGAIPGGWLIAGASALVLVGVVAWRLIISAWGAARRRGQSRE
jgi:hypothetical protein